MSNLAVAYLSAGRLELAVPLFEETIKLRNAKIGRDHPHTLASMYSLAAAYEKAGKLDLAVPLYEETLKLFKAKLGPESPETLRTMASLGSALMASKDLTRAEVLLRECLATSEKTQPQEWRTFNTQSLLGGALLGQKNHVEAEPLLLKGYEGMKQREKSIPYRDASSLTEALDRLVELYRAIKKPNEVKKWQTERAKSPTVLPPQPKK